MPRKATLAVTAILSTLSLTACAPSRGQVTVTKAAIEYTSQDNPALQLPSPQMPPVPASASSDKQKAAYVGALYAGLKQCKITIDTYKEFRRTTGGLPQ